MGKLKLMRLEENTIVTQAPTGYKRIKKRYRRRRPKKRRYVFIGILLFLVVLGIASSIIGYPVFENKYHQDLALAQSGVQDLETATALLQTIQHDPLNSEVVGNAQRHFTGALASFTRLKSDLASLPDALTTVP